MRTGINGGGGVGGVPRSHSLKKTISYQALPESEF